MKFLVINGPNLNLLGIREPEIYGRQTLSDLEELIRAHGAGQGIETEFFQSNHEGAIVDAIQNAVGRFAGLIINPAAYTHTSIAILDAIKATGLPTVEVHLSDISEREAFRQVSYAALAALATVKGKGFAGYLEALDRLRDHLSGDSP